MAKRIEVGGSIGPYRILQQLGAGGAGDVFLAEHSESREKVALKTLRPGAEEIEDIHARFIREITVAQKLESHYVVAYRDCGVDDGVLYYAMQYLRWGSLSEVLAQRGVLTWQLAVECGIDLATGLDHFHSLGILHRDVKPANIFLSEEGHLQLGDFGLARDVASHRLTMRGTTVGTGKYLAPEQARGEREIDGRVDLYQLGCNLYQYMVGRTPFAPADGEPPVDFMEMMRRHVQVEPPKLSDSLPHCPPELSVLIAELLAKDRDDRPENAKVVAERLQKILDANVIATPVGISEPSKEAPTDQTPRNQTSLTERLREGAVARELSAQRLWVVCGVVLVVILIAAVAAMTQAG